MTDYFDVNKNITDKIDTQKLEQKLKEAKTLTEFLEISDQHLKNFPKCHEIIEQYRVKKKIGKAKVIRKAHIQKTHGYDVFKGKIKPSRDKLICLIYGLEMSVADAQFLLQCSGFSPLNPKCKRDGTFRYGLDNKLDLIRINIILDQQGLELLDLH